ncbi:hypothetical protein MKW98_004939, partial [Papaver atlanticum]
METIREFVLLLVEIQMKKEMKDGFFSSGASSGILLGAVTLPSVVLSRLIQLSRAVESKDIGPQELDYLIVQFWFAHSGEIISGVLSWISG